LVLKRQKKKKSKKQLLQRQKPISIKKVGIAELAYREGTKGASSYLIKAGSNASLGRKPGRQSKQKNRRPGILPEPSLPHADRKSTVQSFKKERRVVLIERVKTRRPSPQSS
jgi:hypothetical protein